VSQFRWLAVAALVVCAAVGPVTASAIATQSAPAPLNSAQAGLDKPIPDERTLDEPTPDEPTPGTTEIAAVHPNPVADGDRGEFVVLVVPSNTSLAGYRLTDGDGTLAPANATVGGRIALSPDPAAARNLTDRQVVAANGSIALANGGERLRLRRGNETVAAARYREAPEGEIGRYDARGAITWEPLGTTDRPVVTARGGTAQAFVLPDAPGIAIEAIRDADRRVLVAGYTFASRRVATALERAADRGVTVRVLLEGDPVDGISRRQADILDSLAAANVTVDLLGGPYSRYAFHHAKYAVVDDRAVVLTENWKPSGTGGHSNRGWGVVVSQSRTVSALVDTFEADADWRGARPWRQVRQGRTFRRTTAANGSYPANFNSERAPVNRTSLLVAPDNAGRAVEATLDNATESIDVIQMSIDGPDQRFLRATVRAARRGVAVRILLSSAWYVEEENRRLVDRLRERSEREDLPLEAKLVDPEGSFEKVHAKGVVVDGDEVILGSLNWNGESIRQNREVMLRLAGERVGSYYESVFEADWSDGGDPNRHLPVGIAAAVLGCVVIAVLVARRIDFGEDVGVDPR